MFEPVKQYAFLAAQKYKLGSQAQGALVCEKARQIIGQHYPDFKEVWHPQKFVAGSLTIRATGSSGGTLFMDTQGVLEKLNQADLPQRVQQIKIVKN